MNKINDCYLWLGLDLWASCQLDDCLSAWLPNHGLYCSAIRYLLTHHRHELPVCHFDPVGIEINKKIRKIDQTTRPNDVQMLRNICIANTTAKK